MCWITMVIEKKADQERSTVRDDMRRLLQYVDSLCFKGYGFEYLTTYPWEVSA